MDRFLAMQTFVRVVETGNFSAVAREQKTTQSAVSKQIATLEKHLGVKLLMRTTRSLATTEDGVRYFEDARRLVAEVAEAEGQLRRGEQQLVGWLRVAASVGYGVRVLMPHVRSFLQSHPAVKIDLKLDDGLIDLVGHGIDVAVRVGELADSTLVARRIDVAHRVLVASRGYVDGLADSGRTAPQVPGDLHRHPCIVYTELATTNVWDFSRADGARIAVRVEGPLQSNSSEVIRSSVLNGIGIACSPTWLFDDVIASGAVQVLMADWSTRAVPVHLVSPQERRHSAKVRAFGEHVATAVARS